MSPAIILGLALTFLSGVALGVAIMLLETPYLRPRAEVRFRGRTMIVTSVDLGYYDQTTTATLQDSESYIASAFNPRETP